MSDSVNTGRTIDAHLHLWNRSGGGYGWVAPELGSLYRDFAADEAEAELRTAGIDAAILVQADDSLADTRFMLAEASANDWIVGVVGWVRLDDEQAAAVQLDELGGESLLRGIRHLVHDDPRDEFLDLPAVRASLRRIAAHDLAFDVPDAWPRHLGATRRLAADVPELTVVVDHLGKPPAGDGFESDAFAAWEREFRAVAALPNTVAKFSGLHLPGAPFDADTVGRLLDTALDAFGADRLLYGGDWPMSVPHGGYAPTWRLMRDALDRLAPQEREAIVGGNAERVYRLLRDQTDESETPQKSPQFRQRAAETSDGSR
ncbi:amidohydrolase family protein [Agromyces intestinalis]|uniref:Amidohydrolase family protein n=1 Tax=Agromyces intestinalis TaxID=2592652 RepID=A0A5C1YBG9_9MICO|nr:amidohydrolase family protein [Agromyces intestinalis]QEO13361.1 amidohydrolase family protein [Agromyces intestinalis]